MRKRKNKISKNGLKGIHLKMQGKRCQLLRSSEVIEVLLHTYKRETA